MPVHHQPWLDHRVPAGFTEALRQRHLEICVLRRDTEVGQQAQVDAAAHAVAVDRRDRRLGELPQVQRRPQKEVGGALIQILEAVAEVWVRVLVRTPARYVAAAETFSVGLEDDHLDVLVTVGLVQTGVDLLDQLGVLGVGLVGPVEDDPRDRRFPLIDD